MGLVPLVGLGIHLDRPLRRPRLDVVPARAFRVWGSKLISQKVFIKSFCRSQFPHKSVNSFLILVMIKDELTDLCGN